MVSLSESSSAVFSCLLLFSVQIDISESTPVTEVLLTEPNSVVASGFKILYTLYDDCTIRYASVSSCLKDKAITLLDRVNTARKDVIRVGGGILEIVRTSSADDYSGRSVDNIGNSLDNASGEQAEDLKLNAVLFDRITRFFNMHTLKINFPKFSSLDLQRSVEEGMVSE